MEEETPVSKPSQQPQSSTSPPTRVRANSRKNAIICRQKYNEKQKQIYDAVKYCIENNVRGKAALSTGRFPLIKDHKTIARRLTGNVIHGLEHIAHSILLPEEEEWLLGYTKNKHRAMCHVTFDELNYIIMGLLRERQRAASQEGREVLKLSYCAESALKKGKVGKHFWYRFNAKHVGFKEIMATSKQHTATTRCQGEQLDTQYEGLAEEMITLDIMKNAEKINTGVWGGEIDTSRVYVCYQTIIPDDSNELILPRSSEEGDKRGLETMATNDVITMVLFFGLCGTVPHFEVLPSITPSSSDPNRSIRIHDDQSGPSNETGDQNGLSFLQSLKKFTEYLREGGINFPVLLLTDYHESIFDLNVIRYARKKHIILFVALAASSAISRSLRHNLLTSYHQVSDLKNTEWDLFANSLSNVIRQSLTAEVVANAFDIAGITANGLSVTRVKTNRDNEPITSIPIFADYTNPLNISRDTVIRKTNLCVKIEYEEENKRIVSTRVLNDTAERSSVCTRSVGDTAGESSISTRSVISDAYDSDTYDTEIPQSHSKTEDVPQINVSTDNDTGVSIATSSISDIASSDASTSSSSNRAHMRFVPYKKKKKMKKKKKSFDSNSSISPSSSNQSQDELNQAELIEPRKVNLPELIEPRINNQPELINTNRPKLDYPFEIEQPGLVYPLDIKEEIVDVVNVEDERETPSNKYHPRVGDWVKVMTEGHIYIAKVVSIDGMELNVRRLKYQTNGLLLLLPQNEVVRYDVTEDKSKCDSGRSGSVCVAKLERTPFCIEANGVHEIYTF